MSQHQQRRDEVQVQSIRQKIDEGWEAAERGDLLDGEDFFRQLEREEKIADRKRRRV